MKKLSLEVLKNVLCDENIFDNSEESKLLVKDWSNDRVEIKEWLSKFNDWWNLMNEIDGAEFGDSEIIEDILREDYKLSEIEIKDIMEIYFKIE